MVAEMQILVFGKTGQLARELAPHEGVTCLGRDQADLMDPAACAAAIRAHAPAAVINAAAYTAVDRAEEEEELACRINGAAPTAMAEACADLGIPLVQISTDYVFAGDGTRAWQPADPVAPLNAYGRSKLLGEAGVRAAGGVHGILRCSWVISAHGHNFVKTMLRLGQDRDRLTIVADQIGAPTPARDLAAAALAMARQLSTEPEKSGTYHMQGTPVASWADVARCIFDLADLSCEVVDIPTSDYPTPALRPLNSRLDCTALETVFGIPQPDWRQGIADILTDLGEST